MILIRATALAGLMLGGNAIAQGYFPFENIPGVGSRPAVQIDLSQQMLSFVTAAAGAGGDPEAAELLAGIEQVRVRVYEELEDAEAVMNFIDDTSSTLEGEGWQPAVSIQDGTERVRMYMRFVEDRVAGMTVMVIDGTEAVFINIAGTIDPAVLGALTRQMGLNQMLSGLGGAVLDAQSGAASPGAASSDAQSPGNLDSQ